MKLPIAPSSPTVQDQPAPVQVRRYASEAIEVSFEARRCIHAGACVRGLPAVFDTGRRPWILPSAAGAEAVANVVQRCPSGALHFTRLDGGEEEAVPSENTVVPTARGPLYVRGEISLKRPDGSVLVEDTRMALCRCGESRNKPFCDNSHRASGFDDLGHVDDGGVPSDLNTALSITATKNGPLLVEGALVLRGAGGQGTYVTLRVELCRCGHSESKPFCDGTHAIIGFRTEPIA